MLRKYINRGLPNIKLIEPRFKGNMFLMEHKWEGIELYKAYAYEVMKSICFLMRQPVVLQTKNHNGDEVFYYCQDMNGDYSAADPKTITREQLNRL